MKPWLEFVSWFNGKAKNFSIRLVKWTGKSSEYVHPKHLIHEEYHFWFLPHLKRDDVLLDLGCGGGAHTLEAAPLVQSVKGIDHSEKNLKIATHLAAEKKLTNIQFKKGNLEQPLDEKNSTYSSILALDILEHLVNRKQFLEEAHRMLKNNGKLFLSVPNVNTKWKHLLKRHQLFYYSDADHKHEYSSQEIKTDLEQAGFEIKHFDPTVYDTPLVGLIDVVGGLSLGSYRKLSRWKRERALKNPDQATGFRIIAEKV